MKLREVASYLLLSRSFKCKKKLLLRDGREVVCVLSRRFSFPIGDGACEEFFFQDFFFSVLRDHF